MIKHKFRVLNKLKNLTTINNIIMAIEDLNQMLGNKMNNPIISSIIMKIYMLKDKMVKIL